MNYESAMRAALERAKFGAIASGDVPVGAVMLNKAGEIIALGVNQRELLRDPVGHAEIVLIRSAARSLGTWRLDECTLLNHVRCAPGQLCNREFLELSLARGMRKLAQPDPPVICYAIRERFTK